MARFRLSPINTSNQIGQFENRNQKTQQFIDSVRRAKIGKCKCKN